MFKMTIRHHCWLLLYSWSWWMTWLLKTHKALKEQSDGSFESICWILCFVGLRMLGNDHTLCSHGLLVTNINKEAPPTSKSSDPPPRSDGLPPPLLTTSPLVASQPTSVTGDSLLSTHPQHLLNSSQNAWQWPMIILHEVRALPCTNMPQSSKYLAWNPVSLCLAVLKCGRSFLTKSRYVCASIQLTPNFPWLFTMNTLCSYVFWLNPVMKVTVGIALNLCHHSNDLVVAVNSTAELDHLKLLIQLI